MSVISFWNRSEKYYKLTGDSCGSIDKNPALSAISNCILPGMKILDVGCGVGSKLIDIGRRVDVDGYGVDVSSLAIRLAKKKNKYFRFVRANSEMLPFNDNFFDVAFSTYVFEHTANPAKVLSEMKRVVKKGGRVIIVCPNFGSPLYPSPITPKVRHILRCINRDVKYIFSRPSKLEWFTEQPVLNEKTFMPDFDTTVLPYAYSMHATDKTAHVSSVWNSKIGNNVFVSALRSPFMILGILGIYPFKWWGPICYYNWKK